jgi:hypothetical protein
MTLIRRSLKGRDGWSREDLFFGDGGFGVMTARRPLPSTISVLFIAKDSVANGCVTVTGVIV